MENDQIDINSQLYFTIEKIYDDTNFIVKFAYFPNVIIDNNFYNKDLFLRIKKDLNKIGYYIDIDEECVLEINNSEKIFNELKEIGYKYYQDINSLEYKEDFINYSDFKIFLFLDDYIELYNDYYEIIIHSSPFCYQMYDTIVSWIDDRLNIVFNKIKKSYNIVDYSIHDSENSHIIRIYRSNFNKDVLKNIQNELEYYNMWFRTDIDSLF